MNNQRILAAKREAASFIRAAESYIYLTEKLHDQTKPSRLLRASIKLIKALEKMRESDECEQLDEAE